MVSNKEHSTLSSCKMVRGKAEKLVIKEKQPEARKADAGGKVNKGDLKVKTPKKGSPTVAQTLS